MRDTTEPLTFAELVERLEAVEATVRFDTEYVEDCAAWVRAQKESLRSEVGALAIRANIAIAMAMVALMAATWAVARWVG